MGPGFMQDFDLGRLLLAVVVAGFTIGVVVGVPLVLLVGWILKHLTVGWQ